jgi:hypothetical protein
MRKRSVCEARVAILKALFKSRIARSCMYEVEITVRKAG